MRDFQHLPRGSRALLVALANAELDDLASTEERIDELERQDGQKRVRRPVMSPEKRGAARQAEDILANWAMGISLPWAAGLLVGHRPEHHRVTALMVRERQLRETADSDYMAHLRESYLRDIVLLSGQLSQVFAAGRAAISSCSRGRTSPRSRRTRRAASRSPGRPGSEDPEPSSPRSRAASHPSHRAGAA